MKSIVPSIMVDTCVWIDNYLGFRDGNREASAFITAAVQNGAPLLYAVTSIKDVYYAIGRFLKVRARREGSEITAGAMDAINAAAQGCIKNMDEIATAVGLDASDVWLAKNYCAVHDDFEDNFVLAAAERSQADFLVTTDKLLLRDATVAAKTPGDMLVLLNALGGI